MNNINPNTPKSNKDIILEIIATGISRYSANLELCKKAFSEESVHGLRVSIRRLITIVRVINKIIPNENVPSLLSSFKSHLKLFNPLRDTQVMMLKIEEMAQRHPALEVFGSELKEREKNYILALKKGIQHLSFSRIQPALDEMNESLGASVVSGSIIFAHIINSMNSSFTKVIELNNIATSDNMESLHKVRLAFKKFRYRAEAFTNIINYPECRRKQLGKFQDTLGAIQDNSVLMKNIEEFSINNNLEKDFLPAIIELREEGVLLVNNYFSNSDFIFNFWSLPQPPALS